MGLETAGYTSNIGDAQSLLNEAIRAERKTPADTKTALKNAIEGFKRDPGSLALAFCILRNMKALAKAKVPLEVMQQIIILLRQQENVYRDAVIAIRRRGYPMKEDIAEIIEDYKEVLKQIRTPRKWIRSARNWKKVYDTDEAYIDKVIELVTVIKSRCKDTKTVFEMEEFQALYSSDEMKKTKNSILKSIRKQMYEICRYDYDPKDIELTFKYWFAKLILEKVDPSKIRNRFSFASYCKITLASDLKWKILKAKFDLSREQLAAIRKKCKTEEKLRQKLGRKPSDDEIAEKMGITMGCLRDINQLQSSLSRYALDTERDSDKADEPDE